MTTNLPSYDFLFHFSMNNRRKKSDQELRGLAKLVYDQLSSFATSLIRNEIIRTLQTHNVYIVGFNNKQQTVTNWDDVKCLYPLFKGHDTKEFYRKILNQSISSQTFHLIEREFLATYNYSVLTEENEKRKSCNDLRYLISRIKNDILGNLFAASKKTSFVEGLYFY